MTLAFIPVVKITPQGMRGPRGYADGQIFATRDEIAAADLTGTSYASCRTGDATLRFVKDNSASAFAIQDAAGNKFVPDGQATVEHFGAFGDLTYTLGASGYERTGGTDDRTAFLAADAWSAATGKVVHASGEYYVSGTIQLAGKWVCPDVFKATIWQHLFAGDIGILVLGQYRVFDGFRLISQFDVTTKPGNSGQIGCAVNFGQFYEPTTHVLTAHNRVRVLVCRAADTPSQQSFANILVSQIGRSEFNHLEIGLFGKSNVTSRVFQSHWGCRYDPASLSDPPPDDRAAATILETWHPHHNTIRFLTEIDRDEYNIGEVCILSAVGANDVGPMKVKGGFGRVVYLLSGDQTDSLAVSSQIGLPGNAIKLGFVHAIDLEFPDANEGAVEIIGRGTSKWEDISGTSPAKKVIRQLPLNIEAEGFYLRAAGGANISTAMGIRVFGCIGKINLGDVWCFGFGKSDVEAEFNGELDLIYAVRGGNGLMRHEYTKGGRILSTKTARGDAASPTNGDEQPGWSGNNYAITFLGRTTTTTTTANVAIGDTTLPISPFGTDLHVGTRLVVGGHEVMVREMADDLSPSVKITPMPAAVSSGATVTVREIAVADYVKFNFESSEFGALLDFANIKECDVSDISFTGQYAFRLLNGSRMNVVGGRVPMMVGRQASTNDTFYVDQTSNITFTNTRFDYNPAVRSHLNLVRGGGSGPWGRATLVGCVITCTQAQLVTATVPTQSIVCIGCVDGNGAPFTIV